MDGQIVHAYTPSDLIKDWMLGSEDEQWFYRPRTRFYCTKHMKAGLSCSGTRDAAPRKVGREPWYNLKTKEITAPPRIYIDHYPEKGEWEHLKTIDDIKRSPLYKETSVTNQEILEKAIQKAIDGGWKLGWMDRRPVVSWGAQYATDYDEGEGVMVFGYHAKSNASQWFFPLKELIFNHDFAKAVFGDEPYYRFDGDTLDTPRQWQYHLQQMVIAEDPIKYLGENV